LRESLGRPRGGVAPSNRTIFNLCGLSHYRSLFWKVLSNFRRNLTIGHLVNCFNTCDASTKITPAQEELWNNVTQVMRDNAKTMEALIKARSEKASTMTAVDDLKSYSEIAEAHGDGLKKFIPVFEPLHASMSDAQKKNADTLFRHHGSTKSKAKAKGK
jgi:hypothetical protein